MPITVCETCALNYDPVLMVYCVIYGIDLRFVWPLSDIAYSQLDIATKQSDVYCSSFECSDYDYLVNNADSVVCEETGCTKDLCCEGEGEASTA